MALEDLLKELITSTKDLTETTKALMALRSDAIEAVKKDAAPAAKATTKPAETKPAETKAAEPEVTSAAGVDPKVYEKINKAVAAYVGGATREEERIARREKVKKLYQLDQVKKPGTPDNAYAPENIKDEAIDSFNITLASLVAKGDLTSPPAAASNLLD